MRALRRSTALAVIALGMACASAPPPRPPPPEVPLASGEGQLVAVPIQGTAQVAVRVLFYTGSIDDPPGKEGLTALTARMMAEGGSEERSYPELLRALYPLAADIRVQVDKEQTSFFGRVHKDQLANFLPLLAEIVIKPRLAEADFQRLRLDLVNDIEKRLRATDDEALGKEVLNLMMYPPQHPYGHFVGGAVGALRSITLEDVKAHHKRVFGRQRVLLGIAGAIDQGTEQLLSRVFADLPVGTPRLSSIPLSPPPPKNEVWIVEKPSGAVAISIGRPHRAFRGHPDFPALAWAQSHLGEHRQFHGVLMAQLREERGLNYGDYAYVESFLQEGWSRNALTNIARRRQHFEIWIRPVAPSDAVFALRAALYYYDRFLREGVSQEQLDGVSRFLDGYSRLWELTPMRRLGYALDDRFYGVSGYLDGYRSAIKGLSPSGVMEAARKHLRSKGLRIAMVASDAEALKQALLSGAKSEKSYEVEKSAQLLADDAKISVLDLGLEASSVRIVKVEDLFQ